MINQEVKGTLAKLLATENLTVEHRKVSTACFDVEKRLLILPIWKTASNNVYDLLVGHEVGHALYTPNQDFGHAPKAFVNVLEDARIERMMKVTYPGLKKSFFVGYNELWDDDFFGVKGEKLDTLSLIDRINLYFKGNPNIPFTDEEKVWVERTSKTVTFEDVVQLAIELYEYACKKQEKKEYEAESVETNPDGESFADDYEQVTPEDSSDDEKEWPTESDPEKDHRADRNADDADLETPSYVVGSQIGGEVDETECITDTALQDSLQNLIDENAKEWVYLTLPKVDVDQCIVPFDKIQADLNYHFYEGERADDETRLYHLKNVEYAENKYIQYKRDAQKSVNYLVKQFEMKKSADNYKRTAVAKTGVIDTNSLYKYKLTDDIFKKMTITPDGKNHGLIMYLDWSGSMNDVLLDTIKQLYNLIWFCKKAGIPFRVYAFQSGTGSYMNDHHPGFEQKENVLSCTSDFKLLELVSSRQNARSLEKSMRLVFLQVFAMNGWRLNIHRNYNLGGTPLADAVLCSRELVSKMKRVENITKVNVVTLSDGESNPISFLTQRPVGEYHTNEEYRSNYLCHHNHKVFFLKDPKTGYVRKLGSSPYETTKEIVSFFREITDYNWIGIRICSKGELARLIRYQAPELCATIDKQWKKHRFASVKDKVGFTESFYIPDRGIGYGTEEINVKQKSEVATKAELSRAFKKHMSSKKTNKTILNAFIEQIA